MLASILVFAAVTASTVRLSPPADSLSVRLRRAELGAARPREAGEAALMLGRLEYARGEYRSAADAFARAAARLDPARKSEALYWAGLSWLGLRSPNNARATLEEVVTSRSPRSAEALLGIAVAWEQAGRPDRAYDALERLLSGYPGEAGPAALERLAALADRFQRPADAGRARARLLAVYPASMEAAVLTASGPETGSPSPGVASGRVILEVGRFTAEARAKTLAARAARAGFPDATVVSHGAALGYVVRLGSYPDVGAARKAQGTASRELGLASRMRGER